MFIRDVLMPNKVKADETFFNFFKKKQTNSIVLFKAPPRQELVHNIHMASNHFPRN